MNARRTCLLVAIVLFTAGAATAYFAVEDRLKAAGAMCSAIILTAALWVDICLWLRTRRVGPLLIAGTIERMQSRLGYWGLIFLYVLVALLSTWVTYRLAEFALRRA